MIRKLSSEPEWTHELQARVVREAQQGIFSGRADEESLWRWLTHPWDQVRYEALMSLLSRREPWPGIFTTLADMVDDTMVREFKEYLADVLARYGPIAEAPLRRLLSEGWWAVRMHAADGLAKVGTPDSIPELRRMADSDPDRSDRERAATAIASILARHPAGPTKAAERSET